MQWFRDRKTVTKLMIGFGIMALFIAVLGFEGLRNITSLNAVTHDMYQHHAIGLNHLLEANVSLIKTSRSLRNALLAKDDTGVQQAVDQLQKDRLSFSEEFEGFQKLTEAPAVRAKATIALDQYREVVREHDQIIALVRAKQHEEAMAQLKNLIEANSRMDADMGDLVHSKLEAMQEAADGVDNTARAAESSTTILIVGAIVAALLLGFFIARLITNPLRRIVEVARNVAAGDFDQSIDFRAKDETGVLAEAFSGLIATLKGMIGETRDLAVKMAERDLTGKIEGNYQGDFAIIKNSLNTAAASLQEVFVEVKSAADSVSLTAKALTSASDEISSGAQEQASSLEETASSLEEITATVKQNADSARQASQLAAGSRDSAEKGGQVVKSAIAAMTEINQSSSRIADIITTIDEIAFQTNLLALNAAVEAARAGEQGRGFAVVAAEVRNLAQRSATAAKEIKGLIQDSVRKVENGSELVNRSGQTLEEIVQSVKRVTDIVTEIAAASREQYTGIEQVNKATMQMDQVTQTNASQTEEMASTAQGLLANAEQLQALVAASFRMGTTGAGRPAAPRAIVAPPDRGPRKRAALPARAARHNERALVSLAQHTAGDTEEF
jgi:methyl-accepting chemotaxis protein